MRILVLDNYDSFTYNIAQYLGELGADPTVVRNDAVTLDEVQGFDADGIVVSPGPGHPSRERDFGVCGPTIDALAGHVPILGVCLGLQGIAHRHGARVVQAPHLVHGKAAPVRHDGSGLFAGLPSPLEGGRYHSLVVDPETLPDELEVPARGPDDEVMALRHRHQPLYGIQFHPESILTPTGHDILENFLEACT